MKMEGVVVGIVSNNNDPEAQNRVKLRFPWMEDNYETDWVRIATPMSGPGRGFRFMPEVDDEALVAFEHGHPNVPYVIGFLHNGKDDSPNQSVPERMIRSVNGHAIRFFDSTPSQGDKGGISIEDAHGNKITFSNGKVTIKSVGVIELDSPAIVLGGSGYKRVIAPNSNPI